MASRQIRCPHCHKLLCKTEIVEGIPIVVLKHKGIKAVSTMMILTCPGCKMACRVTGTNGIEEKVFDGVRQHN